MDKPAASAENLALTIVHFFPIWPPVPRGLVARDRAS